MSSEVFNPNPTIFAPVKSKKAPRAYARPNSLWLDDGEQDRDDGLDQSDDPEAIDQDEIFGMSVHAVNNSDIHSCRNEMKSSSVLYLTPSIGACLLSSLQSCLPLRSHLIRIV